MRNTTIAALLFLLGVAMIVGSYFWFHKMSKGTVWSKKQAEERIHVTSRLHSEINAVQQEQLKTDSENVSQEVQQRLREAQERHAAVRDEFRRAKRSRDIGTYALRTGGCLFMLIGAMIFLFVQKGKS